MSRGMGERRFWWRTALASLAMLLCATAASANIVYTVDRIVGRGAVFGTITTDGTLGTLGNASKIVAWSLTIRQLEGEDDFMTGNLLLTQGNSALLVFGDGLTATATELLFNFAGSLDGVLFQLPYIGSGYDYWCLENSYGNACIFGNGAGTEDIQRRFWGLYAVTHPTGSQVIARVAAVPEPTTLALLGLGLTGLVALRRRRI